MKVILLQLTGQGGTQLYFSQLVTFLSKTDCEITALLGNYLYKKEQYEESKAKIVLIDAEDSYIKMSLKLINPYTYYSLLRLISNEQPDIVHLAFEDIVSGILLILLKAKGQKLVLTEHDPSPHTGEKLIETLHVQLTKRLIRNIVDRIIVHGESLKENLLIQGISRNKICVIPHGDFSYYTKWAKMIEEEPDTILFFGRILEYKGLDYLIRAVPLVTQHIPNLKVIIAGNGNFENYRHLITNSSFFEIHNRLIPDEEVATLFQRSKVVVLPYIDGSQSGVIPIAYAFKKPVIVTNVGSIAEFVENNQTGYIVPPKNSNAIADAIIRILKDDSARIQMGEQGHNWMNKNASWEVIAQKTIEVYKRI